MQRALPLLPSLRDPNDTMPSEIRAAPSSLRERRQRARARRRQRTLEPPPQLWAKVLVGVHVAMAPLLLAGAFPWAAATSSVSSVILLTAVVLSDRGRPLPWSPGVAALLLVSAATALQVAPLPLALVELLSPLSADDARHVAAMLGDPAPAFVPLSRDPGRTRLALLLGLNVLCTALALGLLVERQRPRGFVRAIALACSVVVVVSLVHAALGAEKVFGLYTPLAGGRHFGPIINVNHLGAFAAMTMLLCLGLGLDEEPGARKSLALIGASMAGSLALLTASRGAALSVLVATALAVWLSRRAGARIELGQKLLLGALVLAASVGFGLVIFGFREVQGVSDVERLDLFRRSAELTLDHVAAGTGRGAFEPAFLFRSTFLARYTHPENVLLQYSSELGVPLTLLVLAAFGRSTLQALRGAQRSAALTGAVLVMLFLHDLFDFALELSGVAVPAAACAGIAWTRAEAARKGAPFVWSIAAAAALGVSALVVRLPVDDPAATRARLEAPGLSAAQLAQLEREIATLHPADGVLTGLMGHAYAQRGSARAGRWLNRSMYLAPEWADPHALAAMWLMRIGLPDQALLEVREADRLRPGKGAEALCAILAGEVDIERIRQASVDADALVETLQRVRSTCGVGNAQLRASVDALLVEAGAVDAVAQGRHLLALAATDPPAARAAADALRAAHPDDPDALAVWLSALVVLDPEAALAERHRPDLPVSVRWSLARLASARNERATVDELVGTLRRDAAGQSQALAAIDAQHGRLLVDMGHAEEGIALLRASMNLDPTGPGARTLLAVAVRGGRVGLARSAAQHICRQNGPESDACRGAERQASQLTPPSTGLAPIPR